MPLKREIGVSNGLTWNEKTNKFYYIDSCDLDVKEFDYDPKTGSICESDWGESFTSRLFAAEWSVLAGLRGERLWFFKLELFMMQ